MARLSPEELDALIQVLDRRLLVARMNGATKTLQAIVVARNALVRTQARLWHTETVA